MIDYEDDRAIVDTLEGESGVCLAHIKCEMFVRQTSGRE